MSRDLSKIPPHQRTWKEVERIKNRKPIRVTTHYGCMGLTRTKFYADGSIKLNDNGKKFSYPNETEYLKHQYDFIY